MNGDESDQDRGFTVVDKRAESDAATDEPASEAKPPKLPPPIKRTTRLGLLAWDAEEEMRNRQHIREQQEGMPTVDLDGLDVMANTKIREAIERGDFDNLPGQTFSTYLVPPLCVTYNTARLL